eukprot:4988081-Pyramimonas_sp.AAC.1
MEMTCTNLRVRSLTTRLDSCTDPDRYDDATYSVVVATAAGKTLKTATRGKQTRNGRNCGFGQSRVTMSTL